MTPSCPCCGTDTPPTLLGTLGSLVWLRCRACGIDFQTPADTLGTDDEQE